MAKLILTLDNAIVSEHPLNKARTTIGRRSVSDVHIDHLAISGEHAAILKVDHDFILEDVGSTNGTRVNGKPIKKYLLRHADVIELGRYQLKYINEAAVVSGTEKAALHSSVVEPGPLQIGSLIVDVGAEPVPSAVASSLPVNDSALPVAKVKLLSGANAGRELTINKALTTLGKVGTQVAVITRRPTAYFITHIEGKTFPIVNSQSIGAQAFALSDHDVVELAGVRMEFYLDRPPIVQE